MNPNNVIHRRRAARNSVKEARNLQSGAVTTASTESATGGDLTPVSASRKTRKRRSFFRKKKE